MYILQTNVFIFHWLTTLLEKEAKKEWNRWNLWDSYRGGLEALLGSASQQLAQHQPQIYRQAINQFIAIRMSVAIKIRMFKKRDRIETYLLACRLRGLGFEQLLPLPFNQICVAAALSYVLEHMSKLEKFEQLVLLGNFDNSIPDYIKSEFGIRLPGLAQNSRRKST